MSHHQPNYRQQARDISSFHRTPEEVQPYQSRTGMKRPRGYSPPMYDYPSDPFCRHQANKRSRKMSSEAYPLMSTSNFNISHGGLPLKSKSDDDISLAEEVQTTPTALPHHSTFMQRQSNDHFQQSTDMYQQQQRKYQGHDQSLTSSVTATNDPSGSKCPSANETTYATDYQPMNSLLGNLHVMRQHQHRRRQTGMQASQEHVQTRDYSVMVPLQLQQQPQNHYHRHYGNYHSVPTTNANAISSRKSRSTKKTVSLRVNSNLY